MAAARPFGRMDPLVKEEPILALELSEPTVFGMSPRKGSISSAGVCEGAETEVSRRDLEGAGSSGGALGLD